ncbi:MAG: lysophospholipid acyltransferase family protein [Proteobacteria bacterium]|nr:lysophospholipid acyltransferase family protein [Pseudomonadota bacterium]
MWGAIAWMCCRLSRRGAERLGALIGAFFGAGLRWRRGVVLANLRAAFPQQSPAALRALTRGVYAHLGAAAVALFRLPLLTPGAAEALLGSAALLELRSLLANGRGVIVLSAHLGYWDLLACAAAQAGMPVNVVTRRLRDGGLNRWWMGQRASCGVRLWPARGSALGLAQCLRRGEIVAMVLDQHEPGGAVVPFFGRPAATPRGLAQLARLSGAPVVPAFLVRRAAGPEVELLPPLHFASTPDPAGAGGPATREARRRADDCFTAELTRILEAQVRRFPDQWFWVHRRWKVPLAPG